MKKEREDQIIAMSKEFDEKNGFVTCEISIHKRDVDELEQFVKENTSIKLGKWVIMECDTCVGYHGEGYLHASIETHKQIAEIEQASNYIRTI